MLKEVKLFEFCGTPGEDGCIEFSLTPTEELANELSPALLAELSSDVSDTFIGTMTLKDEAGKDPRIGLFKVSVKFGPDGRISVDEIPSTYFQQFIDGLSKEGYDEFIRVHDKFMDKITDMLADHFSYLSQLH